MQKLQSATPATRRATAGVDTVLVYATPQGCFLAPATHLPCTPQFWADRAFCRDVAPKAAFKAHDGEVLSATLSPVPTGAPEAGPLRLITAGDA